MSHCGSWKQEALTYLSKTTAEEPWSGPVTKQPSSHRNFTSFPLTSRPVRQSCFSTSIKTVPELKLAPHSCKLTISGWIFLPLYVDLLRQKESVCVVGPTQQIGGLWGAWGRREACVRLQPTTTMRSDFHMWSRWWQMWRERRFFSPPFVFILDAASPPPPTKGRWGVAFIFHLMRCTLPFIALPTALKAPFMYGFTHTNTHSLRCIYMQQNTHTLRTKARSCCFCRGHEHSQ